MDEAIAYGDTAPTNDSRVLQCDDSLFKRGSRHHDLPGRAWRIGTLNRLVVHRVRRIVDYRSHFLAAFSRNDVASEHIWIEARNRDHCKNLSVLRVRHDRGARFVFGIELLFGNSLNVQVERGDYVLTFDRLDRFKISDGTAPAIVDQPAHSVRAAK